MGPGLAFMSLKRINNGRKMLHMTESDSIL